MHGDCHQASARYSERFGGVSITRDLKLEGLPHFCRTCPVGQQRNASLDCKDPGYVPFRSVSDNILSFLDIRDYELLRNGRRPDDLSEVGRL